jgi:hypothetical protein
VAYTHLQIFLSINLYPFSLLCQTDFTYFIIFFRNSKSPLLLSGLFEETNADIPHASNPRSAAEEVGVGFEGVGIGHTGEEKAIVFSPACISSD